MIYKAKFYNQTGNGGKHSIKTILFTDCKANNNPIGFCDKLGVIYYNLVWFELSEYNPQNRKFEGFFAGMNF